MIKPISLEESINLVGRKVVVYGFAGVGKTPLALTMPGRGLIVNAEAGLLSLRGRPSIGSFDVVTIESMAELQEVYALLKGGQHGYSWVMVDSISEVAEVLVAEEKRKSKDPRQAYGALADRMAALLRAFRDLPCDVIMTAKAIRQREEETGRTYIELALPGSKVGAMVPYLFDEVFYMLQVVDKDTGDVSTWLQTRSDNKVTCRDRSGRLDAFEPADLNYVLHKINGNASTVDAD